LLASLREIARVAAELGPDADWRASVVAPLSVTVTELLSGIERRQRGFDLEQEQLQREIGELIAGDWLGAVERCQKLLTSTTETLRELNQVLLADTHAIHALLQDIEDAAAENEKPEAEQALRNVAEQIDRIAAWGSARQRAWSEYYQYVHRYLRDVVRLDPSRTLVHRLREQLAGKAGKRFALCVAAAPSIRLLRPIEPEIEQPPLRRPRKQAEAELTESPAVDPDAELEARVRQALDAGARELSAVTAAVTRDIPKDQRFAMAGRVAQAVARVCRTRAGLERPWVPVGDGISIEDWPALEVGGMR
jgi:chromosome partition protein MukF